MEHRMISDHIVWEMNQKYHFVRWVNHGVTNPAPTVMTLVCSAFQHQWVN
jgi:hypothetical protein